MAEQDKKAAQNSRGRTTSWDGVADWYDGWMGPDGSDHHRKLALPTTLALLRPQAGERVLDVGAGQGVLAPPVLAAGASYTGVDLSPRLLRLARRHHPKGRFLQGNACRLHQISELHAGEFDAVVFLLSIQNMDPLADVLASATWALRVGGRIVMLLTHPCFRVPRQSGWGWDSGRRLRFRRIDHYLTPLAVPMKAYGKRRGARRGVTYDFHRPLEAYVSGLVEAGCVIDHLHEIPTYKTATSGQHVKAENRARREIPLFLALRAVKRGPSH